MGADAPDKTTDASGKVWNANGTVDEWSTFKNQVSSSEWFQSIQEMTQPHREALHGLLPEVDFFNSSEDALRPASPNELAADQALDDAWSEKPERLYDGYHTNEDGSKYTVKDGRITEFTTPQGQRYSHIQYVGDTNLVESLVTPEGRWLVAGDNGFDDFSPSGGYSIIGADGVSRPASGIDTAYVNSSGFITQSGSNLELHGMNGTYASMRIGDDNSSTTTVRVPGFFNKTIEGTVAPSDRMIRL